MGKTIEENKEDQACLSYWLSTSTTLLFLLQRTLHTSQVRGVVCV
jgi:hypothetical protein